MNDYTIYCTKEQTQKALKLGAPMKINSFAPINGEKFMWISPPEDAIVWNNSTNCLIPTAEQMINWLEEQGVFISIIPDTDENTCANYVETKELSLSNVVCSSRQEATLDAIDTALEYLINNKK